MRRLSKALTALGFAASMLLAGGTSASATGPLVNIELEDIFTHNTVILFQNISVPIAAVLCDVNVNVLTSQLDQNGKGSCPGLTQITKIANVIYA
ncbi:MAG TPA: hypothetical protein VMU51_18300 [Mycobacteriales bacterium]|nr:hypothetical protein [Mycobacteriales bacterium]